MKQLTRATEKFEGTVHSPDNAPPVLTAVSECSTASFTIADTGENASLLAAFWIDSSSNVAVIFDTAWKEGVPTDSTSGKVAVIDPTKPAIFAATVYDFAGNSTALSLTYVPENLAFVPPLRNLGSKISLTGPAVHAFDTIYNNGNAPLLIDTIGLKFGDRGFSLLDSIGGPLITTPVAPHSRRVIEIQFLPLTSDTAIDSIVLSTACITSAVAVIGSGASLANVRSDRSTDAASIQAISKSTIRISVPEGWLAPVHLELMNALSEIVYIGTLSGSQRLNVGTLPFGTYFYRLTSGQHNESGKLLLGE